MLARRGRGAATLHARRRFGPWSTACLAGHCTPPGTRRWCRLRVLIPQLERLDDPRESRQELAEVMARVPLKGERYNAQMMQTVNR